ncbi:hypothetical protein [Saccharopolyspora gloriosae]|uniref:hypothetical protein n=1 Tax=Saccharopolyspora gloriosae TaxID=455344 RepID=UPI001FB693CE|nr:hypothetical protein [Saccharopolyspora gloriosae]
MLKTGTAHPEGGLGEGAAKLPGSLVVAPGKPSPQPRPPRHGIVTERGLTRLGA